MNQPFDPSRWIPVEGFDFSDITYHRAIRPGNEQGYPLGIVRIAFDRPDCLNSFRPQTVDQLYTALEHARCWSEIGCVILTGNGPSEKHGKWSFCAGGDQRIRGKDGYKYTDKDGNKDPAKLG